MYGVKIFEKKGGRGPLTEIKRFPPSMKYVFLDRTDWGSDSMACWKKDIDNEEGDRMDPWSLGVGVEMSLTSGGIDIELIVRPVDIELSSSSSSEKDDMYIISNCKVGDFIIVVCWSDRL
jgi:hypothetical protein